MLRRAGSAPPRMLGARGRDAPPSAAATAPMHRRAANNATVESTRHRWGRQQSAKQLDVVVVVAPCGNVDRRRAAPATPLPTGPRRGPSATPAADAGRPRPHVLHTARQSASTVGAEGKGSSTTRQNHSRPVPWNGSGHRHHDVEGTQQQGAATSRARVGTSQPIAPSSENRRVAVAAVTVPPTVNGGVGFRMTSTRCTEPTQLSRLAKRCITPHGYRTVKREAVWLPSSPRHVHLGSPTRSGAAPRDGLWYGRPALQHLQERLTAEHILHVLTELQPREVESYVARHCHAHHRNNSGSSGTANSCSGRNDVLQFLRKYFGLRSAVANHREPLVTSSLVGAGRLPPPACQSPPVRSFVLHAQNDAVHAFMRHVHVACLDAVVKARGINGADWAVAPPADTDAPLCRQAIADLVAERFRMAPHEIDSIAGALMPDALRRLTAQHHELRSELTMNDDEGDRGMPTD